MEPNKNEIYCFIEGLRRNDLSAADIHRMICRAWGENIMSARRVREIVQEFAEGRREQFGRFNGSGRRKSEERLQLVAQVRREIERDPRISVRRLAFILGTTFHTAYHILIEDLECISMNCRFVPHRLSEVNKANRVTCCGEILNICNTRGIRRRLVHTDEKWFYLTPMGNKATRKSWVQPGGDTISVARRTSMDKKFLALVAINFHGLSYSKVLERNETVDSQEYILFLVEAFAAFDTYELRQTTQSIQFENCFLQHDNARPHVSRATQEFLVSKNCTLLKQPPYSPDTNILDRFVFPKLEMERSSMEFETSDDVRNYLQQHLQIITPEMMSNQLRKLTQHCQDIIDNNGDYVF